MRAVSRRAMLGWFGAACVAAAAGGCTPSTGGASRVGNSPRPTPTPAPVRTVTWSFWGNAWETETNRRIARLFEAEHPGVRVEVQHVDWADYLDWLRSEWGAGRSPDVMFLNYVPMRAAEGMLEDLDPFLARDAYDVSDFYPALLEQFRHDGRYFGLPRDNDTKVVYFNQDAFDAAQLAYPAEGWTWEDLRRAALRLSNPPSRYGFGFETSHWWRIWLWQNGTDIVDDPYRPTRVTVNSPAAVEAVDYLAGLIVRDRVTPPLDRLNGDGLTELFQQGRLAMAVGNHGQVPSFVENPGLRWDVAPLARGRVAANVAGGAGYVISRFAADKALAWEFVKFLVSPKGEALFAESGIITPARRSVREDHIFLRRAPYSAGVFAEGAEIGRPNLIFKNADALSAALDRALDPVWRGERSAADALNAVAPELERLLDG